MKSISLTPLLLLIASLFLQAQDNLVGQYDLSVTGWKNTPTGQLEVVGKPGDFFGRVTFQSTRERVYALGLEYQTEDSVAFFLAGGEGYLRLKPMGSDQWKGAFKYFGLRGDLKAIKIKDQVTSELQQLTGLKPLALGIISTKEEESFPSFDASNQVLYFTRGGNIIASRQSGKDWLEPQPISFSRNDRDSAPYLSPDGTYMIFTSNRPIGLGDKKNLWRANRENGKWADPFALPSPINIDSLGDYHAAVAENGSIYFVSYNRPGGEGRSDLYRAEPDSNGGYTVQSLGREINTGQSEADVYVSPDQSYMLFASTNREDSYGTDDIYISINKGNGWSEPKNLGPKVNSFAYEYGAWVDEENGYLYFNSFRRGSSDIYRIPLADLEVFRELDQ